MIRNVISLTLLSVAPLSSVGAVSPSTSVSSYFLFLGALLTIVVEEAVEAPLAPLDIAEPEDDAVDLAEDRDGAAFVLVVLATPLDVDREGVAFWDVDGLALVRFAAGAVLRPLLLVAEAFFFGEGRFFFAGDFVAVFFGAVRDASLEEDADFSFTDVDFFSCCFICFFFFSKSLSWSSSL